MGKAHSIEELEVSVPSYPGQWTLVGRTDYCELVRNSDTGFIAQQYIVPADTKISLINNYEIYDYRRKQDENLVEVYQVQKQSSNYICQGGQYLKVKTQRVPQRLSDIGTISLEEGIFILNQALIGYRTIYNFQGPISINDDMIGFNQNGQVKVWLNNNFAKNSPDIQLNPQRYEQNTYHSSGITNQAGMVSQVVDVIQQHIDQSRFRQFLNTFYSIQPRTFTEALNLLREYTINYRVKTITEFRNNGSLSVNTVTSIGSPSIQNTLNQQEASNNMIRSVQAPLRTTIIQNYAPSTIISYEQQPPISYYVQQPITSAPFKQIIQTQPQLQVKSSQIVTPRSTIIINQQANQTIFQPNIKKLFPQNHVSPKSFHQIFQQQPIKSINQTIPQTFITNQTVNPTSQIIENNPKNIIKNNSILNNEVITPLSQIRPNIIQNKTFSTKINKRQSQSPLSNINPKTKVSPFTTRQSIVMSPREKIISPSKIHNRQSTIQRNKSPINLKNDQSPKPLITIPNKGIPLINIQQSKIPLITENKRRSLIKQENRRSIAQSRPTHSIGKRLQQLKRNNSSTDHLSSTFGIVNPLLVQQKQIQQNQQVKQVQQIINKNNKNSIIHVTNNFPRVTQTQNNIVPFNGLPHRRNNINKVGTPINIQKDNLQLIEQNNETNKRKIKTQQTLIQKLQTNITKTVKNFSTINNQRQETFKSYGTNNNLINNQIKPEIRIVNIANNVNQTVNKNQAQHQANQLHNSFNYQPSQQLFQNIQEKPLFDIGDNIVQNISRIQQIVVPGSGISTFTNPLEQKPQIDNIVFTSVKSYAINDSVNPQIRKLMMIPINNSIQKTTSQKTNIFEQIPLNGHVQSDSRSNQKLYRCQIRYEPFTNSQNFQPLYLQQPIQDNDGIQNQDNQIVTVQVTKNDIWNSNDSVPTLTQNIVNQESNQVNQSNPIVQSSVRNTKADIQLMMRQHKEQSKNLFQKYQEYGKNLQRQLSPNNPTSPSSFQKQINQIQNVAQIQFDPNIVQEVIVVDYQQQRIQQPQPYQYINRNNNQQYQQSENYQKYNQLRIFQNNVEHIRNQTNIIQNIEPPQVQIRTITNQVINDIKQNQSPKYEQPSSYQYYQNYTTNNQQSPQNKQIPYQYVTSQNFSNQQNDNYERRYQQRYQRNDINEGIYFQRTTESFNYQDIAATTIQNSRGIAPTYEQLRAALLETNVNLNQQSLGHQQYNQYRYQTTTYDDHN